ncbi:MAG: flagellar basal body rod protein FlgB [Wenzhouxiangellaceae bacterium]|nr:flagellar basal body rod protein FlgB [Wenzhouxiangellaceae bacterium]
MQFNLDNYFGIHEQALKVRAQRTELIASNLANADTPGFKARDIDFRDALKSIQGQDSPGTLRATQPGHFGPGSATGRLPTQYRVPMQPTLDGNTVETDREQAAFAENTVRYQATLQFLGSRITNLITALRGGSQ